MKDVLGFIKYEKRVEHLGNMSGSSEGLWAFQSVCVCVVREQREGVTADPLLVRPSEMW